jgi:DinB superfamily
VNSVLAEFAEILENTPVRLLQIGEAKAAEKTGPGRWSRKEILGHLIDSAANNHQRFVRAQLAPQLITPAYEQAEWVALQDYATEPWADLAVLWSAYNRHLLHVLQAIPQNVLWHEVRIGSHAPMTLQEVAVDYVTHLQHHLAQIFADQSVT